MFTSAITSKVQSILIAGTVALGTLAAASGSASAEVRGGIYLEGPGISVGIGDRGHRHHRR